MFYVVSVKPTEVYQSQPAITLNVLAALGNCSFCLSREITQVLNQINCNFWLIKAHMSGFYPPIKSRNNYVEPRLRVQLKQ